MTRREGPIDYPDPIPDPVDMPDVDDADLKPDGTWPGAK